MTDTAIPPDIQAEAVRINRGIDQLFGKDEWALRVDTEAVIGMLAAALMAQRRAGDWQPIETYPKNGEQFLVTDGDCVIMAEAPNDRLIIHDITSLGFSCEGATHWMHLPAPPLTS